MTRIEIERFARRVEELGPWVHGFYYRGRVWGGKLLLPGPEDHQPISGSNVHEFFNAFPAARRILELGTLEGTDTFQLASRLASTVVTIEGREENWRKARFLTELYDFRNVFFLREDLETFDLSTLGRFDAVHCCGVLYHLHKPWRLIERLSGITDGFYLWTHYWASRDATETFDGYNYHDVCEKFSEPLLRGLSPTSRWFTKESLFSALSRNGFSEFDTIHDDCAGNVGTITVVARMS